MILLAFIASLCVDPKQEQCRVACIYESFDTGRYENKKCACVTYYLLEDLLVKKTGKNFTVPVGN